MFKKNSPSAAQPNMKKNFIKLPFTGGGKKKASAGAPPKPSGLSDAPSSKPAISKPPSGKPPAVKKAKGGGGPLKLLLPLIVVVVLGVGGYLGYTRLMGGGGDAPPAAENSAPALLQAAAPIPNEEPDSSKSLRVQPQNNAPVTNCAGKPRFLNNLELVGDVTFATNEKGIRGLILFGATAENSDAVARYQHQSWSSAGFLDAFVLDKNGNVYFAPSPRTGLGVSEPQNQDHIFKLNTRTGELASYITLPAAAPPSPENPYGVLGLAYDCDSNSLFATTVTGSTPENQVGRIFRIAVGSGEIVGQRDNVDGYGIAVLATANGKQLIFGSPRDGELRALDVDAEGNFLGEPRTIARLPDPLRARKISFANQSEMLVQGATFEFASAEIPQETELRFLYDAAGDAWTLAQ